MIIQCRINNNFACFWWSVTFLLYGHVRNKSVVAATASSSGNGIEGKEGVVSLMLTPRHAELERRRRRQLLNDDELSGKRQESVEEIPRRRDEAVQVGALFEVGCPA